MAKLVLINANMRRIHASPPLNIAMIASYLEKHLDFHETEVIDVNFVKDYLKKIIELNPEVVGISSMTIDFEKATEIAKNIKKNLKIPVIIGGVHISTLPTCLRECFDIGVIGEGEETMLELMKLLLKKKKFEKEDLKKIKGIVFHDKGSKGGLFFTKPRPLVEDMSRFPIPNKRYIDRRHFDKKFIRGGYYRFFYVLTARGCPFNCVFCAIAVMCNRRVRFVPVEYVAEEIDELVNKYKIEFIHLCDATFNLNKRRVREIIEALKKRDLIGKVKFGIAARAEILDEEFCKLFKEMGVVMIGVGFESGSPRIIKFLKGDVTIEDNQKALLLTKKYGFETAGSLIMASPGETLEDMEKTIDFIKFAKKHKIYGLTITVMTPFPATKIWDTAKKRGKVGNDMNFDILSQENVNNPLLLDDSIPLEKFKKIFYRARKEVGSTRKKTAIKYFVKNPIGMIWEILKKPIPYLQTFKHIFIQKSKYNVDYGGEKYAKPEKNEKKPCFY